MLIQAANGAVKKKKSFYQSKYHKLRFRLGSANKAKVAIANKVARAVYKIMAGDSYKELGYSRAVNKQRQINSLMSKLKLLGVQVRAELHEVVITETVNVDVNGVPVS